MTTNPRLLDALATEIIGDDLRVPTKLTGDTTGGGNSETTQDRAWVNPMTDYGSIIEGGEDGGPVEVVIGTEDQVLTVVDVSGTLRARWADLPTGSGSISVSDTSSVDLTLAGSVLSADVVLEWLQDTVAAMITGGSLSGITATYQDASGTIDLTVTGSGLTQEQIEDFLGTSTLQAGTGVSVTYNDGANTITIAVSGLTSANLSDFTEAVQDVVGAFSTDSPSIDVTYDDGTNTLTWAVKYAGTGSADTAARSDHNHDATYQPLDSDLTAIAALSPTNDDIIQRKAGAWTNRSLAQLITDLTEQIQDLIGSFWVDTGSIDITYNDASNQISAAVVDSYINALIDARLSDLEGGEGSDPGNWLQTHRFAAMQAQPGSTTVSTFGGISGTASGTISGQDDTDGNFVGYSTTTLNATGGRGEALTYWADWGMTFVARFKTFGFNTSIRHWIGMSSVSSATLGGSDAPTHACAMFRGSSAAGDTNWKCVTSDRSGSQTITDSGVAMAANTAYTFKIIFGTVRAKFYINGTLVATHDTGSGHLLPGGGATSANRMGWYCQATNLVGGAGTDRGVKIGRILIGTLN